MSWWVLPFTAFAQNTFPFPSIEIKDKPVLTFRAGLSSLGGMEGLLQQGRNVLICPTMRYLPPIGYGRNTDSQIVQELILQSLNAGAEVVRVLDTPWATPERCARASGLDVCATPLMRICLSGPHEQASMFFVHCPAHPSLAFISLKPPWKRIPSFLLHTPCLTWTVPNRNSCCICSWDSLKNDIVFQLLNNMKI